jgi:hypothetical protein
MTSSKKILPLFPLANPGAFSALVALAAAVTFYAMKTNEHVGIWGGAGILPLIAYLGYCRVKSRKILLAEKGREREIVKLGFVALAADRTARVWSVVFGIVAIATCLASLSVWAYQAWHWYRAGDWLPVTWISVTRYLPNSGHESLQRLLHWLADTNMGVVVLILGLLLAAPIAATNSRYQHRAKVRRKDLSNLKRRS